MREIFGLLERIAPTEATVLIEGETGTGKDLVARTIHELSPRAGRAVRRGRLRRGAPATLIESELFGHEKGAFTGAAATRQGAFEQAQRRHDLPRRARRAAARSAAQAAARARAARDPPRRRQPGRIKVDIRVVAATKHGSARGGRDAASSARTCTSGSRGADRALPPLRERKEDIPLLVARLPRQRLARASPSAAPSDERLLTSLMAHDWPGNVRELRNVIERGVALGADPGMLVAPLGDETAAKGAQWRWLEFEPGVSFRDNKEK